MERELKVTVARHAGYCFGVRDAVAAAFDSARQSSSVYMLGHIVHNEQVVDRLAHAGVKVVGSLDEVGADGPLLLRAHGTAVEVQEQIRSRGLQVIDMTCPLVHQIHDEVKLLAAEGRRIIIIGDHGHDEVVGIASQVEKALVVSSPAEADQLPKLRRIGVVSQSTQSLENVQAVLSRLLLKCVDLRFINTICFPTKQNQTEIIDLAQGNDVVVIVGSFTSANTKRLTQIAGGLNPRSHQVETAAGLQPEWFDGARSVGVSAGASTPDYLIEDVVRAIEAL
ncbi:MAG TPA: 4-hydroxy-3-methylbut-2-enyl diphosphate reductase [Acidobacteriota bacterium]